jgi:putative aldouronate transport system substrate-binding protein
MKVKLVIFVLALILPGLVFAAGQAGGGASSKMLPTPAGQLPIVKEPVTLKVWVAPEAFIGDFNTNKATIYYEEMTGVHVEWTQVAAQDKDQKLTLTLSSGSDLPDVFSTRLTNEQLIVYGSDGIFIPVNDLIEEWSFGIFKLFKIDANARSVITAPDGNIYSLPYLNECYHCKYAQRAWVNVPWLEKLGLDMPETTDDLYEMLKAFKENDANGNGKDDEIPMINVYNSWHSNVTDFLMNPFTFNPDNTTLWRYIENGSVVFAPTQPGWKDGLKYIRKLFAEGLIDPESFTIDTNGIRQLTENPSGNRVGFTTGGHHGMFTALDADGSKNDYEPVMPLIGPSGKRQAPVYYTSIGGTFSITKDCEIPEIAYRWGDMMYDDKRSILGSWGQEGEDWRPAKPGELGITGKQATWVRITEWGVPHNSHWGQTIPSISNGDTYYFSVAAEQGAWNLEHELWKASEYAIKPYGIENKALPPLFLGLESTKELAEPLANLRQFVDEWNALFVTGKKDIDADWDDFLSGLDDVGIDNILKISNEGYKRQYQ